MSHMIWTEDATKGGRGPYDLPAPTDKVLDDAPTDNVLDNAEELIEEGPSIGAESNRAEDYLVRTSVGSGLSPSTLATPLSP